MHSIEVWQALCFSKTHGLRRLVVFEWSLAKRSLHENMKCMTAAQTSTNETWHLCLRTTKCNPGNIPTTSAKNPKKKHCDNNHKLAARLNPGDWNQIASPQLLRLKWHFCTHDIACGRSVYGRMRDLWYVGNLHLNTRASKHVMCPYYKYTVPLWEGILFMGVAAWFIIEISRNMPEMQIKAEDK